MFSIICVTEVRHLRSRGFGNCGIFLAHNYVSEQFGNYVVTVINNVYIVSSGPWPQVSACDV